MFQIKQDKRGEFEERLEEIKRRIEEKKRISGKLEDLEMKIRRIEEKISKLELPTEIQKDVLELRNEMKNLESRIFSEIDKTQKDFLSLKNEINIKVEEKAKEIAAVFLEEKVKSKINTLDERLSELEKKMNKLVEVLEVLG